jgi:hypothetical protein
MRVRYTAARKTELYESDTKFAKVGRTFKKICRGPTVSISSNAGNEPLE